MEYPYYPVSMHIYFTPTTLWSTPTTLCGNPTTLWSTPTTQCGTPTTLWSASLRGAVDCTQVKILEEPFRSSRALSAHPSRLEIGVPSSSMGVWVYPPLLP